MKGVLHPITLSTLKISDKVAYIINIAGKNPIIFRHRDYFPSTDGIPFNDLDRSIRIFDSSDGHAGTIDCINLSRSIFRFVEGDDFVVGPVHMEALGAEEERGGDGGCDRRQKENDDFDLSGSHNLHRFQNSHRIRFPFISCLTHRVGKDGE